MKFPRQNRLSREYINSLPIIKFGGKIELIEDSLRAETALKKIFHEKRVGFDTESRPAFRQGQSFPISLVQIATKKIAYLFRLNGNGLEEILEPLLTSDKIKKIGIGLEHDISKMKSFNGIVLAGLTDLSAIARIRGIIQTGARGLTARYLGKRLVKTAQTTNWARNELSEKQKIYAATDAWVCLKLYKKMKKDKTDYRKFMEDNRP